MSSASRSADLIFPSAWKVSSVESINEHYLEDETECVTRLLKIASLDEQAGFRVRSLAEKLVTAVRENRTKKSGLDAFLQEYDLSSKEGVVLMCLAEALLRIPDADTADALIKDKISDADWSEHLGTTDSIFVNASTWGLMLTGKLVGGDEEPDIGAFLKRMVARAGEPVVRGALRQAMKIMGHQYVMGQTIGEATKRAQKKENRSYRYSYDMLWEAALTAEDADRYFQAYSKAIEELGDVVDGEAVLSVHSISVKLSALHPRYEFEQRSRVLEELTPRLLELAVKAKQVGVALTMDAEEAHRLEVSLELFQRVFEDSALSGWEGLGLAVQAYQKRALSVVDWLVNLAQGCQKRIPVRLVKGAYWDSEIKWGQMEGIDGYPVFTRKTSTDVSYLACAKRLLSKPDAIYPQFATHNARTVSAIIEMAGDTEFEFQRLHGMGEELYEEVVGPDKLGKPCRVYAPVGNHKDLLPYLVRRLLENGANTSFVNRIIDEAVPISDMIEDPVVITQRLSGLPHPKIPLPKDLYGPERLNSRGLNVSDGASLRELASQLETALEQEHLAVPIINGEAQDGGQAQAIEDPSDRNRLVGSVVSADETMVNDAITAATVAQVSWNDTSAKDRAQILLRAADLYEENRGELIALLIREAGKTLDDAVAELREAVDFLRFYANLSVSDFSRPVQLPGPTGESNELWLTGKGVFVCISPWNFPLAIFTGQIAAALAAGNSVIAKPAEQTPLVAHAAISKLFEAGVPSDVLHFLPGDGAVIGAAAVAHEAVAGVAFTGSTETAQIINRSLAEKPGAIATLIAETGGQNAMIVDSSALPEQVVLDVVESAFHSAGQRCSALRILCVQEEIADRVVQLLMGYANELVVGDPGLLATDVGPVIDRDALSMLNAHVEDMRKKAKVIYQSEATPATERGNFMLPTVVAIPSFDVLAGEVFGPVLHVYRYQSDELDQLLDKINGLGYGLTLGIHSRVGDRAEAIFEKMRVGNCYVNRNMVGAVVGTQPFGGCNLSGTGPKAGGPHYLHRFATEKTRTVNTAAVGGNASLLSLED
ncbi:MAG: bifunctional proline dehydrogenase/L-glutamate gamma-semialdehyde dehydrogenase PutA [Pseudomonadota bacterium]